MIQKSYNWQKFCTILVLILHESAENFYKFFSYSLTLSQLMYLACIPLRTGVFSAFLGFIYEEIHRDT